MPDPYLQENQKLRTIQVYGDFLGPTRIWTWRRALEDVAPLSNSCQLTAGCTFDRAHARQSKFSPELFLNSAAVIEERHLTQTNDAELKMKNDKLDLKKINAAIMRT